MVKLDEPAQGPHTLNSLPTFEGIACSLHYEYTTLHSLGDGSENSSMWVEIGSPATEEPLDGSVRTRKFWVHDARDKRGYPRIIDQLSEHQLHPSLRDTGAPLFGLSR